MGIIPQGNKANIRLWVDALRSGAYERGEKYLATSDNPDGPYRYCCLGVACEVAIANGVPLTYVSQKQQPSLVPSVSPSQVWEKVYHGGDACGGSGGECSGSFLPAAVQDWLGLHDENPIILFSPGGEGSYPMAELNAITANDSNHWSFEQIADALETTYLKGDVDDNA